MLWKIVLALGVLGVLLGILITAVSAALPFVTNGRTSWEEALLGIVPGVLVLIFSFFVAVVGLVLVLKSRKKS